MFDADIYEADHAEFHVGARLQEVVGRFVCSIDTALFISSGYATQKEIDDVMLRMATELLKVKMVVSEKNGIRMNKDGTRIQKNRNRVIAFDKIAIYYHNRHPDATLTVNPHFHILLGKKTRAGRRYRYLKKSLSVSAKKYDLKFHFMEDERYSGLTKKQENFVRNTITQLQRNSERNFKRITIMRVLMLLEKHFKRTRNISFFIKQVGVIYGYFQRNNMDFIYGDINLRNQIFFYLDSNQEELIEGIKQRKCISLDMNNVFDREVLKYSHGFKSEAMKIVTQVFNIAEDVWAKMEYSVFKSTKKAQKEKKEDQYSKYYFSIVQLLEIAYSQDIFSKLAKPILLDYVKKYSTLYDITVFDSEDTTIAMYSDRIVLKESRNITDAIKDICRFFPKESHMQMDIRLEGKESCTREFETHFKESKTKKLAKKNRLRSMSM